MDFKTWFNKNFSLSLDGKWKGLDNVINLRLFEHKVNKVLTTSSRYGSRKRLQDSFSFMCSGQRCKLYYR